MVKITKIKAQKSQKRVNVYLDGKFAFGLPVESLVKAGLRVGQELSEKEIEDLIFENEFQKALDKTFRLISFRPRSEKEIRNYLKKIISRYEIRDTRQKLKHLGGQAKYENKKKPKERLIEKVIESLKKKKLIDDVAFANWWLEQRATFRPRGKFGLRAELRQKGINREIIQKVVEEIDEVSLAEKAAAKKFKAYKKLSPREFRQKMSAFLSRQGFSWEVIGEVLEKLKPSNYYSS